MLELKSYSKEEMVAMFKTKNNQGLQNKLLGYGVMFDVQGTGKDAVYTINNIAYPFKIYCITELDCNGRNDFYKLRNYYYHFFNDEEFSAMPCEVQESRMRLIHKEISRQTIAGYLNKLYNKGMIEKKSGNFIYYFAYKGEQRIVEKAEYIEAWHEYWDKIRSGYNNHEAIYDMICRYGGVARKQEIPMINGIYNKEIEYLCNLIQQDIETEVK